MIVISDIKAITFVNFVFTTKNKQIGTNNCSNLILYY